MRISAQLHSLALPVFLICACGSQGQDGQASSAGSQSSGGRQGQAGAVASSNAGAAGTQGTGGRGGSAHLESGSSAAGAVGGSSAWAAGGTSHATNASPSGTGGTGGAGTGGASGSGKGGGGAAAGTGGGTGGSAGSSEGGSGGAGGSSGTGTRPSYNPCDASSGPCKILPLGDSITFGGGSAKVNGTTETYYGGYRVQLFTRAVNANQRITFVGSQSNGPSTVAGKSFPQKHEGHSGWVIDQIAGIVPSPALNDKPDIILLLIGTNDMYQGDVPSAPDRLGKLMDKILAADSHALLVVSAIPPWAAQGTKVPTYNSAIVPLVETRAAAGKHIMFADVTVGWDSKTMFGDDNLHPNWKGYNLMGDLWYKAVGSLFPQ